MVCSSLSIELQEVAFPEFGGRAELCLQDQLDELLLRPREPWPVSSRKFV